MARDTRVAGIYSEIKYRFDPKSLKELRKFKKEINDLRKTMLSLNKIKASPRLASKTSQAHKQVKVLHQQNKAKQKSIDLESRLAQVETRRRALEKKWKSAGLSGGALGTAKSSFNRVSDSFAKGKKSRGEYALWYQKQLSALQPKIDAATAAQRKYNAEMRASQKSMRGMWSSIARVAKEQQRLEKQTKKTAMSFKQLRSQFVGFVGAYTAFSGLANINRVGQDFENAGIMMKTALGEDAGPAMEFLINQSKRLGINAAQSAKGFSRYALAAKQLGFSFQDVKNQFLGVAEAATVFGLSQEQINGTIRALEQMASKGQIMAEELKLQLGDRMPAVMQIAAKSMGMTTKEFLKAMEEGKVAAEDFLPAFSEAMRELAAPGLGDAFKTVSVAQKRMMAQWELFKKSLFDAGLGKLFKELFNMGEDLMVVLEPILTFLISTLTTLLRAILWPIRLVIALIADVIKIVNYYLQKLFGFDLTDTARALGEILGTILSLVGGIFKVFSKLIGLLKHTWVFRGMQWAFQKASGNLKTMSKYIDAIVNKLKAMPMIGKLFDKAGTSALSNSSKMASKKAKRVKSASNFIDYGTSAGAIVGGMMGTSGVTSYMKDIAIEIFMNDNAKEMVGVKVDDKTTSPMNIGTRG